MSANEVVLEKIQVGVMMTIDGRLLDPSVDFDPSIFARHVEMRVRGFLLGEKVPTRPYHYPADWIQAVKERWAPLWARRRWPVRYATVDWEVSLVYPDLHRSLAIPPDQRHIVMVSSPYHGDDYYQGAP